MQSMFLEPVTCVFLKVVHDPKRKKKTTTLRIAYHHRRRQVGFQIFLHLISEKEKKLNATQMPPCSTSDSAWKRYGSEHLIRKNLGKKGLPIESFQNTHRRLLLQFIPSKLHHIGVVLHQPYLRWN